MALPFVWLCGCVAAARLSTTALAQRHLNRSPSLAREPCAPPRIPAAAAVMRTPGERPIFVEPRVGRPCHQRIWGRTWGILRGSADNAVHDQRRDGGGRVRHCSRLCEGQGCEGQCEATAWRVSAYTCTCAHTELARSLQVRCVSWRRVRCKAWWVERDLWIGGRALCHVRDRRCVSDCVGPLYALCGVIDAW